MDRLMHNAPGGAAAGSPPGLAAAHPSRPPLETAAPANTRAGFTLLELILTVAIAGALVGLGGSNVRAILESTREGTQVDDVYEHLLEDRSLARNQACEVTVSTAEGLLIMEASEVLIRSYLLGNRVESVRIGQIDSDHSSTEVSTTESLSMGASADSSTNELLIFNAQGGTRAAAPTLIQVMTRRGHLHQFLVLPAIGSIRRLP